MTLSLRPYQRAAIDALYDYFGGNTGNPLVVMPTGTGKSVVIAGFIREAIAAYADTRVLVLTHVKELIQQNFMALLRAWPEAPAGIYSAGLSRRDIRAQVLFAGIQSIHRHAYKVQRCDLVLIDEAHLLGRGDSGMYRSFLAQLNEVNAGLLKVVGFTATPYRLDSGLLHEGKDRLFTDIAYEVSVLNMIRQGYLSPVVPKQTETQLDVGGVGTRGGEFIAKDLEAAVDRDEVTRAAVAEIVQHGQGRGSWLVFCSGVVQRAALDADTGQLVRRHRRHLHAPREARQAGLAARHLRLRAGPAQRMGVLRAYRLPAREGRGLVAAPCAAAAGAVLG
jgi:DNA repair protein RadD